MRSKDELIGVLLGFFLGFATFGALSTLASVPALLDRADAMADSNVRLVAYGCEGASGPLYATEESDFPRCDRIEPIR